MVQLMLARGCFMVSGYLISVILARGLGPIAFGLYGVIMSVLVWTEMVVSAGIPGAITRLLPQYAHQVSVVEQTARALLLLWSIVLFVLCWVFAPAFARFFDMSAGTALLRLAILDIPCMGMYLAYQGILNGHRRFGALSAGYIVYSLTKLSGTVVLFVLGLSVAGALVVNILATVGALVYLVGKFPPAGFLPSYALLSSMIRVAFPMGLYMATLQVLLRLDLWALKAFWTGQGEVIGFYVAALNIARLQTVMQSVLTGVLCASIAWAIARADEALVQRYIQGASRFAFIILVPACAIVALHAEEVIELFYTSVYAPGGLYLRYQFIAFAALPFLDMFFQALMVSGRYYYAASILLCLTPVALVCNVILVLQSGPLGAAIALMLTVCLGTLVAALLAYQRFGPLMRAETVARVMIAAALMTLIDTQIALVGPWLLLKFVVLLGLYIVFLSLLKELRQEDLKPFAVWQRGAP
jgi:O-antigen/teichoic acid export membrane protein